MPFPHSDASATVPGPHEASGAQIMGLYDSHCHLQDERFSAILDPVIARAEKSGVAAMMCCGCREEDWQRVRTLAARKNVVVSFGLHPWFVTQRSRGWRDSLRQFLIDTPGAGVGEIGLDNAITHAAPQEQEEVFISQLGLARELERPVSIHCRKAFGRLVELLEVHGGGALRGLIHSYSGSADLVPVFMRLGLHLSFSGTVTQTHNKRARQAVLAVSRDRLLIETDSPDLPPAGCAALTVNEPSNLPLVLEAVATLVGMSKEEAATLTAGNAWRLFGEKPAPPSAFLT
jgi:TatD DNase family protein